MNKFTINFAAITGEKYCSSATMTYELLRRNILSTVVALSAVDTSLEDYIRFCIGTLPVIDNDMDSSTLSTSIFTSDAE